MEVALTCRARPVFYHPHIDPSGTGGGTATKLRFRTFQAGMCVKTNKRTRCQVRGTRREGAHLDSEVPAGRLGAVRSEKTTFQAGMCVKTKKITRCQVRGARCEGAHLDSGVQAGRLGAVRSEKTTFQAGMCMKTNNRVRSPGSGVRSRKASAADSPILTPGSLLLTPVLQKMKVHPEMLMKTKDREHGDTGSADSGLRPPRNAGPPGSRSRMRQ
jgi:hypothetical protein